MNQKDQVHQYLIDHGSITTKEAIESFWCTRLSQYILLLKQEGLKITTVWECNGRRRWVRYFYNA